jgi:hypothetical protein
VDILLHFYQLAHIKGIFGYTFFKVDLAIPFPKVYYMPRYFIPGGNSLNQSNIDTNNVCPCAENINKKVINGSNSSVIQNVTKVQKQTEIINYYLGGRTQFGNYSSKAAGIQALNNYVTTYANTLATTNNITSSNSTSSSTTLDLLDPNLYIRCVVPQKTAIKPLKNKF